MLTLNVGCDDDFQGEVRLDVKRTKSCNIIADATELPFQNKSFNNVVCISVLEHIFDWRKALKELLRVSNGLVIVEVPINSDIRKTDGFRLLIPTWKNLKLFFTMPQRARESLWQFKPSNIAQVMLKATATIEARKVRVFKDFYLYSAYRIVAYFD